MKQSLNDFLKHGIKALKNKKDYAREYTKGERYVGVTGSDFDGTYFKTKKEAKEAWQAKRNDETKPKRCEVSRQLYDHIKSIPLFSDDWDSYGGVEMPEHLREALERLSSEIWDDDIQELVDWLEEKGQV